jgi:hypothetical protein
MTTTSTLPAVQCTPWCQDRNGHIDAWHPDGQWCSSENLRVSLNGGDVLDTYLAKDPGAEPYLGLSHNERTAIKLTVTQARELRDALSELLATAERAQR